MKITIPIMLFLIATILFMPTCTAVIHDFVLKADYDYPEAKFMSTPVTNEESKNARQVIMDWNNVNSLEKFPVVIPPQSPQQPVTSPDGTYVVKNHELYKDDVRIKSFWLQESFPYAGVFSPDSNMIVIPTFESIFNPNCGCYYDKLSLEITDPKGSPIGSYVLDIPRGGTEQDGFINSFVQLYWSADGKSIFIDTVGGDLNQSNNAPQFRYIKLDIDYEALVREVSKKNPASSTPTNVTSHVDLKEQVNMEPYKAQSTPGFTVIIGMIAIVCIAIFRKK
jgi:hypothetical protein